MVFDVLNAVEAVVLLTTTAADDTQEDKTAEERHTKGLEQWL